MHVAEYQVPGFSFIPSVCLHEGRSAVEAGSKKAFVGLPVKPVPACTLIVNQDKGAVPKAKVQYQDKDDNNS